MLAADGSVGSVPARRYTEALNTAPPDPRRCTREAGGPVLLVSSVTRAAVKQVVAEVGNCRSVTDGTTSVTDERVVRELYEATRR